MDGLEAVRRIRALTPAGEDDRARTPIVAMTAHAMDGDRDRCLAAGMDDYIAKPVQSDKLVEVLARWLPETSDNNTVIEDQAPVSTGLVASKASEADTAAGGTPGEPPALPVLNLETLHGISDHDDDVERALIGEFLAQGPKAIERCRMMIEIGDCTGLEYWAHTFKGSCRSLGAERAADVCLLVEQHARKNELQEAGTILATLTDEWARLVEEIAGAFQIEDLAVESRLAA
jgi:HPt (histidine-containing phosphotransfer) domain-containing protein